MSNPIILISFIDCTCLEVCRVCVLSVYKGREKSNNFCVNMTKDYVKVSPYHDKCVQSLCCYCYKVSLMLYFTWSGRCERLIFVWPRVKWRIWIVRELNKTRDEIFLQISRRVGKVKEENERKSRLYLFIKLPLCPVFPYSLWHSYEYVFREIKCFKRYSLKCNLCTLLSDVRPKTSFDL